MIRSIFSRNGKNGLNIAQVTISILLLSQAAHSFGQTRKTYVEPKKMWMNMMTYRYETNPEVATDAWVAYVVAGIREPYYLIDISALKCGYDLMGDGDITYVHKGVSECRKVVTTGHRNIPGARFEDNPGTRAESLCPAGSKKGTGSSVYNGKRDYTSECYYEETTPPPPDSCKNPKAGNPIDVFTGAKEENISILDFPIPISLHYHSKRGWSPSFVELLIDRDSSQDWLKTWDCIPASFEYAEAKECSRIIGLTERLGANGNFLDITHQMPDGSFAEFNAPGKSATLSSNEILEINASTETRYSVRSGNSLKTFDSQGRILSRSDSVGTGVRYTYLTAGGEKTQTSAPNCEIVTVGSALPNQPSCLTDALTGRQLNFFYSAEGLVKIVAPGNRIYEIAYNEPRAVVRSLPRGLNLVTSIKFPDGGVQYFNYNEFEKVGEADFPHYLTSKTDRSGALLSEFFYNTDGVATVSQKVGGLDRYEVKLPCYGCDDFSIIGPDGSIRKAANRPFLYSLRPGHVSSVPTVARNEQPAGAGCAAAVENVVRDSKAVVQETVDFNGSKTCFINDEITGRELSRVEGLNRLDSCHSISNSSLPIGARRITSEWHPRWATQTRIASPKLITTFVYNGQPDPYSGNSPANCVAGDGRLPDGSAISVLCKKVETATTDLDGGLGFTAVPQSGTPQRFYTWTYDDKGRLLTFKDPRNVVVLTNEYYSNDSAEWRRGDLKSTKNAAAQPTDYLRYTVEGKIIETRDANGISTVRGYDSALRTTSISTGGAITLFEYYPDGLMKKVTSPDGSIAEYEYDQAKRLTAVRDAFNNRIDYTLDANGKRIKEEMKDPSGMVRRQISRIFDALSREQQITGREQ